MRMGTYVSGAASEVALQADGLSHAEICRACDEAAKMAVLDDRRSIPAPDLLRVIQVRQERRRAR